MILGMADSIAAHPVARTIRDEPRKTELSIFWELDGTPCQARLDCLQDGTIWDIKSCRDASKICFQRSIIEYRYHMQAAWYIDGAYRCGLATPETRYMWIAVKNEPPYQLAVYQCSLDLLSLGHDLCEKVVAMWRECERTGVWPAAYSQEIIQMAAPAWLLPKTEFDAHHPGA